MATWLYLLWILKLAENSLYRSDNSLYYQQKNLEIIIMTNLPQLSVFKMPLNTGTGITPIWTSLQCIGEVRNCEPKGVPFCIHCVRGCACILRRNTPCLWATTVPIATSSAHRRTRWAPTYPDIITMPNKFILFSNLCELIMHHLNVENKKVSASFQLVINCRCLTRVESYAIFITELRSLDVYFLVISSCVIQ